VGRVRKRKRGSVEDSKEEQKFTLAAYVKAGRVVQWHFFRFAKKETKIIKKGREVKISKAFFHQFYGFRGIVGHQQSLF